MFIKSLIITSLLASYSIRTPAIENYPLDYEIRAGMAWKAQDSKYKIKSHTEVLYERETGSSGWGHDFELTYEKPDKTLKKILNHDLYYYRKFKSYDRQATGLNLQVIDTGYRVFKWLDLGYSVSFEHFDQNDLLYYINLKFLKSSFELRISDKRKINTFNFKHRIHLGKKVYLYPRFQYLRVNDKKQWWGKVEIKKIN
jgi:hypothetical protein